MIDIHNDIYCSYNNISSEDLGIMLVSVSSELPDELFLSSRSLIKERIQGKDKSYFFGIEREDYRFDIVFYHEDWTEDKIREVQRWLGSADNYAPFYCNDNLNRIWYCLYTGEVKLKYNGHQGYIAFTMESDSPYTYSMTYTDDYDYSTNTGTINHTFINDGDLILKPEIEITLASDSDGSFKIVNTSNNGQFIEFTDLQAGETIYIDCENEDIISDIPNTYRLNDMTSGSNYLEMIVGNNYLQITGKVKMQLRYQYIYY